MNDICQNCLFCRIRKINYWGLVYKDSYECRVDSPKIVIGWFGTVKTYWPIVEPNDYCSYFELNNKNV